MKKLVVIFWFLLFTVVNNATLVIIGVSNRRKVNKTITSFLILFIPFLSISQTGPGGVGDQTSNRFWQDATLINQANNTQIASWVNNGGNSLTPSQNNTSRQPLLLTNNFNSIYSSVSFDGTNDRLRIENTSDINRGSNSTRSYFCVFRTSNDVTTRQVIFEEGGTIRGFNVYILNGNLYCGAWNLPNDGAGSPWGFFSVNTPINSNTAYIFSFIFNGNNTSTGTISFYLNGAIVGTMNNVGKIYGHNRAILGGKEQESYFENGSSSGTGNHYNGEIGEFIHYNYAVNSAQRIIIENYLAAKYALSLATNDLYDEDNAGNGNYDHEAAGIGRVDASNIHNDAQGTGIVRILNPTNLNNDEFLIWGHNNGVQQAIETTDVPLPVQARFDRVWRASEVNSSSSSVDVGSVDIRFDLTGLGNVTASDLRLLVDTDNDGNFNDETPISGATSLGSNIYEFSGVSAIANNLRFTLGTINVGQTPLPIELIYFNAIPKNNRTVNLNWQTASEINNDYFTVQRSLNGTDWENVTTVDGSENSSTTLTYTSVDITPYKGISYYRLKQTDFDGQFEYSQIRSVNLNDVSNNEIKIYPNPVKSGENLFYSIGPNLKLISIEIIGSTGEVINKGLSLNDSINLSNLASGIYYIKFYTVDNVFIKKIVIE